MLGSLPSKALFFPKDIFISFPLLILLLVFYQKVLERGGNGPCSFLGVLCLSALISHDINLSALKIDTFSQLFFSVLLSLSLILGNNWITYCLFHIILEFSNLNCGRNKLYTLYCVRRDLTYFQESMRCIFFQNLFVRIILENMIAIYF